MSIQEHLNKIRNAIYGREVRESIAKGIETAYDNASEAKQASEISGVFAKEYHDFKLGYLGPTTGEFYDSLRELVTIDYIPVYIGESLVFKGNPMLTGKVLRVFYYDSNKNLYKVSPNYTEREVDRSIEIETDGYIKYLIRYSPLVDLTDSMIADLSSSVYLHRNTIRGSWGKVARLPWGEGGRSSEAVEKTITLEMEASNINKVDGLITNASIENIDIDTFKSTLRTGKFLKIIPSTNIMLNFSDGNAFVFEYDSEFEYLGYTEMTTNSPTQLKNSTSFIKVSIEGINNGYIRPQLTYLGGANNTDWVFNAHKPNRIFDNISFIYETSTNEGRDILDTDSSEKQYTNERYFSSGLLKLPPNYDPHGEPVKLILWFQGSGTYAGIHAHTFGNAYEGYFDYLLDEGYAILSVYQWTTKYNIIGNNNGSPTAISAIVQGYKWATENYNISTTGAFVSGKSSGGYNGTNICYNRGIPILASGLFCPLISPLRNRGGSAYDARLAYAQDFGFEGNHSVLEEKEGSAWPEETEALHDYMRLNASKVIGYNQFWNGLIGESLTDLIEATINGTELDYNLNKDKVRICHVPTKIWTAEDDHVQTARESKIYIKSIQNGQGNAELRLMPTGTGGHNSTDTHEDALRVDSITTKLGIEHTNVPLAYVELVQYFRRFEN